MERGIKNLCRLSDEEMFLEAATGLSHIAVVVGRLDAAAQELVKLGHHHASRIVGYQAQEEAAKALVLIDAVRCPLSNASERSRTLSYYYDHLAKGIYTEVCNWRPVDFAEVIRGVEREREEHHLDGPTGSDWIFPNTITQQREDDLYVGYVRDDSEKAGQGDCVWTAPTNSELFPYFTPVVVDLCIALEAAGVTSAASLKVIADIWRPLSITSALGWEIVRQKNIDVLEVLERRGSLIQNQTKAYRTIINQWPFPLWPLDLRVKKIDKEQLRIARKNWFPD